jgi:hypothetical protein
VVFLALESGEKRFRSKRGTAAHDYTFNGFAGRGSTTGLGKKPCPFVTIKFHMALPAGVNARST